MTKKKETVTPRTKAKIALLASWVWVVVDWYNSATDILKSRTVLWMDFVLAWGVDFTIIKELSFVASVP